MGLDIYCKHYKGEGVLVRISGTELWLCGSCYQELKEFVLEEIEENKVIEEEITLPQRTHDALKCEVEK